MGAGQIHTLMLQWLTNNTALVMYTGLAAVEPYLSLRENISHG